MGGERDGICEGTWEERALVVEREKGVRVAEFGMGKLFWMREGSEGEGDLLDGAMQLVGVVWWEDVRRGL